MKSSCRDIRELLLEQLLGMTSAQQAQVIRRHLEGCSGCQEVAERLQKQDERVVRWSQTMQTLLAQKAEQAAAAFLASGPICQSRPLHRRWWIAAAAAVMILGAVGWLMRPTAEESVCPAPTFRPVALEPIPSSRSPEGFGREGQPESTESSAELERAHYFFETKNAEALAALYRTAQEPTRQAVLNYLARLNTPQSLQLLAELQGQAVLPAEPNQQSSVVPASGLSENAEAQTDEPNAGACLTQPPQPDWYDPNAVDADNVQFGILGIQVVDDRTGAPIPGAKLNFRITPKTAIPETAVTNQFGRYELKYYHPRPSTLLVEVRKSPYSGIRLLWCDSAEIPLQYQIRLKEGVTIGGRVETVDGQPLEGVTISFGVYYTAASENKSHIIESKDLATDSEGRWELGLFPADLNSEDFGISAVHPEYVTLYRYSVEPDMQALLNRRFVIQMRKGLTVGGRVTDLEGRPIEGAVVCTGFSRHDSEKRETQTDAQGRYEFPNCKTGELILTVMAEGYAPDMREVIVGETLGDVDFQLEPGYTVTVRAVDRNGNGIEGVSIQGDSWRTYGSGNQEARTIRCSGQTDALGYATLRDLPGDAVKYLISKKGFASYKNFIMTASEQTEYTVVMLPAGKLTGRVLDGQTGLPVSRFTMIEGIDWQNDQNPTWQSQRTELCTGGLYELSLYYQDIGLAVRIEAEGYLPSESHVYINDGTEIVEDIFLYQGRRPSGIVYLPDGQPASGAEVYVQNKYMQINNGKVSRQFGRVITDKTDNQGRFQLPPIETEPYCLIVLHEAGGAIVSSEEFERTAALSLQAWSRVQGTVYLNNKPAPRQRLALHPSLSPMQEQCGHISVMSKVTTDEEGRFFCDRLFPGRIQVSRFVPLKDGSKRYVNTTFVWVEPGQTVSVEIGKGGRTVTGKLLLPAEMRGDSYDHIELSIQANIRMDLPTSPEIIIPENYLIMSTEEKQKLQQQWMETPAWKEYMKKMAESEHQAAEAFHESVIIESDGTVRAENIPPGDFCLSGSIGDPTVSRHSDQWYDSRIGTVKLFFTVPEVTEETDYEKPVDLGTIPIKLLKRMRVGEDFPAVELVGLDGHPIRLSDYHGCYVLIDFGFVMGSENPGESADLLKTLYTEFHKSRRFEILCVLPASRSSSQAMNDSYRKAILYFLKKKEIPWSVGMVSDEDVLQEFEPGGIYPSLVLVDPEGRIAALNIKPEELLETLRRHLLPKEHSMENPSPTP